MSFLAVQYVEKCKEGFRLELSREHSTTAEIVLPYI
jgi:hypothetical protein